MSRMAEYIYKSNALNVIAKLINENKRRYDTSFHRGKRAALKEALEEIEKIKGTDEKLVKRGRWIFTEKLILGNPYGSYKCSECMYHVPHEDNYCPNCGARMDGDTNG